MNDFEVKADLGALFTVCLTVVIVAVISAVSVYHTIALFVR